MISTDCMVSGSVAFGAGGQIYEPIACVVAINRDGTVLHVETSEVAAHDVPAVQFSTLTFFTTSPGEAVELEDGAYEPGHPRDGHAQAFFRAIPNERPCAIMCSSIGGGALGLAFDESPGRMKATFRFSASSAFHDLASGGALPVSGSLTIAALIRRL
jgi:hypothetical protein